ncbi:Glycosyl hydrolase family 115 [Flagellimonas taeanensis]|uniref:Glycosyl hydrolase family 115 n=1 Tax=Flagellimonas taeanensis TaxID=1005926 RepID=A0A1M6WFH7_9FLAO|nr:glycosyl hydrolase 115 family protein [Allomuricauda taeanensis]SFC43789.1 Glycosyl hydrolase family 115 [Allomuricauda taeanensis]SHK92366.1 Glycosyl hydrolase family 115 [Allomuricauda taeanensis]
MKTSTPLRFFISHCLAGLLLLLLFASCKAEPAQQTGGEANNMEKINTLPTEDSFPETSFLTTDKAKSGFTLVENGVPANILVSESDHTGVVKVAGMFQKDLGHVSGQEAELIVGEAHQTQNLIIVGTMGKSSLIDRLAEEGKIDVAELEGKWEQFLITPVLNPMDGVDSALVIAGSDKRGTIFGMFDLSEQMGVSPWYWWADVPVKVRKNIYAKPKTYTLGEPKVKYRGIFINDEAPALSGWVTEKYGDFNKQFYEKVFELILRMKGNYLWPAMWGRSLWDDDPTTAPLADEMGVVLATSHHEPLMRSHVEWDRYGEGTWDYEKNQKKLREFWREGMERTKGQEKVVTLAMRGDGDEAMSEGTNIDLLEKIVEDQREIIEEVTDRPIEETPQVWALYKEVQDYYDKGMRVPDDVTLLLCDDNWGQVRVLPALDSEPREGGYGMYYHFDFVGGPRSYKWLNTTQIERVWEQMHLTYSYGVDEIWLVNVGDIKPMEFPISFFLEYAWNPEDFSAEKLPHYYTEWARNQFGSKHAKEIGEIIALYTKYNSRRKPELIEPTTYSLQNFNEAENMVENYNSLVERVKKVKKQLPKEAHDAFYQLVQYPVEACANLNEMYVAAGKNRLYGFQDRASTNFYADKTKELFYKDAEFTTYYHDSVANGKWNHMMSQTHMGHISWSDPAYNKMPAVSYIQSGTEANLGYVVENGISRSRWFPSGLNSRSFSTFDPINDQNYYVEIFNMGKEKLTYTITSENDWIQLSSRGGTIQYDEKIMVSIDWDKAPKGQDVGEIVITAANAEEGTKVSVPIRNDLPEGITGFVENNGIVSMDAVNYQNANETDNVSWQVIPNLGRTGSAITSMPVTASKQNPNGNSPYLEYEIHLLDSGTYNLTTYFSPTLNFQKDEGLLYAISIDDEAPKLMNLHQDAIAADWTYPEWWNEAVKDNIMKQTVLEKELSAGAHTIKYWAVDPGLVLQKVVLQKEGVNEESYLGPPESKIIK